MRILASNLSRTTTVGVNAANELTSLADFNGTTSYSYDELGRMTSKARGSSSATYAWHLDDRLMQVNSNFPAEGVVDYNYGGNGDRRSRTYNSTTTTYNWDAGYNVLSEENSGGALTRSYVGRTVAHIDGSTPSSGTYSYYTRDHLLSTRGLYDGSKSLTESFEFSPYGDPYLFASASGGTTRLFTGHDFDAMSGLYFAPFRFYGPGMGRWANFDPLGTINGPNAHTYGRNNPVTFIDIDGLFAWLPPILLGIGGAAIGALQQRGCGTSSVIQVAVLGGGIGVGVGLAGSIALMAGAGTIIGIGAGAGAIGGLLKGLPRGTNPLANAGFGALTGALGSSLGLKEGVTALHKAVLSTGLGGWNVAAAESTGKPKECLHYYEDAMDFLGF